jgi:hypothetical protein
MKRAQEEAFLAAGNGLELDRETTSRFFVVVTNRTRPQRTLWQRFLSNATTHTGLDPLIPPAQAV